MQGVDKLEIGKTIARGGDCIVKKYGENGVIKISTLGRFLGIKHSHKLLRDYKTCKKYFGKYIVKTEYSKLNNTHVEIQEFIPGEKLSKKHFHTYYIKTQFKEILTIMRDMESQNIGTIDLIGFHGGIKLCFDNIIVDKNNNLHIIDATLLEAISLGKKGYFFQPFIYMAKGIQELMILYHSKL